ncbi:MAG: GNAT family N-acetyltransferase, partial [Halonotius sp.]
MEFALLGWPAADPTLRLDYRRFSYAGKFVTGGTGVAVIRREAGGSATATAEKTTEANDDDSTGDADDELESLASLPDGVAESDFADGVLAAITFSPDRTDPSTLKIRYLTVRD